MMPGLLFPQNMVLFLLSTRNLAVFFDFHFVSNVKPGVAKLPFCEMEQPRPLLVQSRFLIAVSQKATNRCLLSY